MKRTISLAVLMIFLLIALISCERSEIEVNDLQTQAFITVSGKMGFSFYANGVFSSDSGNSVIITSPDGNFTWKANIHPVEFNGIKYYGASSFMMPEGTELQKGNYNYVIVCKDGRTIEHGFGLSYQNAEDALERCDFSDLPYYDPASNITVVKD